MAKSKSPPTKSKGKAPKSKSPFGKPMDADEMPMKGKMSKGKC